MDSLIALALILDLCPMLRRYLEFAFGRAQLTLEFLRTRHRYFVDGSQLDVVSHEVLNEFFDASLKSLNY